MEGGREGMEQQEEKILNIVLHGTHAQRPRDSYMGRMHRDHVIATWDACTETT